jgi:hypothetical protein
MNQDTSVDDTFSGAIQQQQQQQSPGEMKLSSPASLQSV